MIRFTLGELVRAIGADETLLSGELSGRLCAGVSTDTRSAKPGEVFFGVRGGRFDGSEFAGEAVRAGAALAVVNADSNSAGDDSLPLARVPDSVKALGDAARSYRRKFSGAVTAITGTNGKTTVKEMLVGALSTTFRTHGTLGNLNNHIGLPLTVFGLDEGHESAVFELGMSAPGEIAYLAGIAEPSVGVLLNVGPGHMEFFENLDGVADAKTELLQALHSQGVAVLNGDDPLIRARECLARCRIVRFGIQAADVDFRGEIVAVGRDGCARFRVDGREVNLRVPGIHTMLNALAAYAAARVLGVEGGLAAHALESFTAPRMRMEVVERGGFRIVNDAYNANPLSMRAAAETLATMPSAGGRLIAALGDMRELGVVSAEAHREAGRLFGRLRPAVICLVGDHAADYREGALESGMSADSVLSFGTAEEAREYLDSVKRPGDTIFVKGSRALGMERLIANRNGGA